jgi:Protein of unknown function (DUF2939).
MPPTSEKTGRPKPSRIVIDLDRSQKAAPVASTPGGARKGRGAKILGIIAIVLVAIVLGAVIGGYFWWQSYKSKPAYTLALLVDAVERNDMKTFDEIVDTDKVVESFVPQVTEKAIGRYASALTGPLRGQVEALIPKLLPSIKEKVRAEVAAHVKEISTRAEGKPFILVALGIPYVVDIKEANGMAKVGVTLKDRPVTLTMLPNGERWKIVSITDDTLAQRIVDNIAKDLPAVGSEVERELRKNIRKNLPGNLPDIPLLNNKNQQ